MFLDPSDDFNHYSLHLTNDSKRMTKMNTTDFLKIMKLNAQNLAVKMITTKPLSKRYALFNPWLVSYCP